MSADDISDAEAELIFRNLQRKAGDSVSDTQAAFIDSETPRGGDGRGNHSTGLAPKDAEAEFIYRQGEKFNKWEWLRQLNEGVGDPERASTNWTAGKVNDAEMFCDELGFGEEKTEKIVEMVTTIDGSDFGSYTTEQITLGCCSLVADADTDTYEDRIILQDEFKELMDVVGLGSREHSRIRQTIRSKSEFF